MMFGYNQLAYMRLLQLIVCKVRKARLQERMSLRRKAAGLTIYEQIDKIMHTALRYHEIKTNAKGDGVDDKKIAKHVTVAGRP